MKLVMTLLVRDEQDIIRENIEFHLAQGVNFFVVTDNKSVDATAHYYGKERILKKLKSGEILEDRSLADYLAEKLI